MKETKDHVTSTWLDEVKFVWHKKKKATKKKRSKVKSQRSKGKE